MKKSIFEYEHYTHFVLDFIRSSEKNGRGIRRKLADFIGCQVSHITAVLKEAAHLSPEQAEAVGRYIGLQIHELEFFMLLVQQNRAGTIPLKKLLTQQLDERRSKQNELKDRLQISNSNSEMDLAVYYSSWQYGAIHMLATIPELNTRLTMAKRLNLSLKRVDEITDFLISSALLIKKNGRFQATKKLMHLERSSPLISQHHINWRMKSLSMMESITEDQLHYTSAVSLSCKDFEVVKEILVKALSSSIKVVKNSQEEDIAMLSMSWQYL